MPFDYEQSIWGGGDAEMRLSSPTWFRLKQALFALRVVSDNGKILEVGCGAGQFIRAVKHYRPLSECHGVDISVQAIALAKQKNDGVVYNLSTPETMPYADNSFDAVVVFDVLEHVGDPRGLLLEISRVLKPQGIFYCFVPCEGDRLSLWHWLDRLDIKRDLTRKYAGHINYFTRSEALSLLAKNNWQIRRVRFSEHLLGQLAGIAAFMLMDRNARRQGKTQINNESFFEEAKSKGGWIWHLAAYLANAAINLESFIFSVIPSPNLHITAINKKS
ncbi:MAG: class I SAM-dependent methyltransferase [bacterium]|nr:class I SAM-dependent methyltransferase [bacterium]